MSSKKASCDPRCNKHWGPVSQRVRRACMRQFDFELQLQANHSDSELDSEELPAASTLLHAPSAPGLMVDTPDPNTSHYDDVTMPAWNQLGLSGASSYGDQLNFSSTSSEDDIEEGTGLASNEPEGVVDYLHGTDSVSTGVKRKSWVDWNPIAEYIGLENIDEAIISLETIPSEHRHLFVDQLINASMEGGNKVVVLAEKLFSAIRSRSVISPEGFERGIIPTVSMADDLSIDVPKTYEWLARMIHAAGLDRSRVEEMADQISVYGNPSVPPRELLIKEFEKVSSA
ncbi:MA3 domain protein, partial [Rhizoctonia solani AG-3 Rhs1AP]